MAVKINIKGNRETSEYKDAIALKEIFENEFSLELGFYSINSFLL